MQKYWGITKGYVVKFILPLGLAAAAVLEFKNTVSCLNPVLKSFFWCIIVYKPVICDKKQNKRYMINTTEC